jgi:hypothetical protein
VAIILSEIIQDSVQGNTGRRSIREMHTDHLGFQYFVSYKVDVGIDETIFLANHAISLWDSLVLGEIGDYKNQMDAEQMIDPAVLPDYVVKGDLLKALIKHAIRNKYPTAYYIVDVVDSLTDTQIKNAVGITQPQVNMIRARVVALKSIHADVLSDNLNVDEDFE